MKWFLEDIESVQLKPRHKPLYIYVQGVTVKAKRDDQEWWIQQKRSVSYAYEREKKKSQFYNLRGHDRDGDWGTQLYVDGFLDHAMDLFSLLKHCIQRFKIIQLVVDTQKPEFNDFILVLGIV